MKHYEVSVRDKSWVIPASSARVAINKILRSVIGTRTLEKMLPVTIFVLKTSKERGVNHE